jgi:O-antigen ligase
MQPPPLEPSAPADPPRTSAAVTRRVTIAAVIAWALLSTATLAAGEPAGALRSGGVLALIVAAVALARWGAFRRASAVALALYAAGLTSATLIAGAGWSGVGDAARVQILTGNPNVLAAALVTAFTAWAAVAPRRRWVWWGWPLVALAVLHTGSRTAGGALLAAGAVWVVAQAMRHRPRLVLAPLIALAVIAAAALAWQRGVVELTPNLLAAPSDLSDPAWRHDLAQSVTVIDGAAPGPFEGTTAQRLIAQARPESFHLAHQSLGRSEQGVPYVASIHLRADEPQRLVLTSHLARVTCEVGAAWSRCVTPVGYGDDHAQRQLHLRAEERGGSVDVYVFGAQYERGVTVTPFLDARPAWVPQAMVNRYDLRRVTFLPENRIPPWEAGLQIAREHPWFGIGLEASRDAFRERTRDALSKPVTYAHNVLLQLLAVHGLVGLVGAATIVSALLSTLSRTGWLRVAPMLVGLALLNTWDVTLFEPTVFVAALLATAYWTAERPAAR